MAKKEIWIGSYDQSEIYQREVEDILENWQERFDEKPTQAEAERMASNSGIYEMEWDQLKYDLTEAMKEITKGRAHSSYWYAEGRNLGWQGRSGTAWVKAENGEQLLDKILPKTDVTVKIVWGPAKRSMSFTVYHHDAPTGEFYSVRPATQKEINSGEFD